ncbi:hypothetical protein FOZG_18317 [Fusarium oxysporum Fo47]|uniref:Uncharacterized protein n=1 Tax=Fusarium oxysporum Fo47 TaxID=660027 RepID=W9J7E7_FUSOX|nr:hypothetical protein FOZG_18317 [Fusarium oxysporum Fo47]
MAGMKQADMYKVLYEYWPIWGLAGILMMADRPELLPARMAVGTIGISGRDGVACRQGIYKWTGLGRSTDTDLCRHVNMPTLCYCYDGRALRQRTGLTIT